MHIRINGIPAPQGSKRHVGNGVMIESSKAVGPWREAVRNECQRVVERPHDFNRCRCDQVGRCLIHCATCNCPQVAGRIAYPRPAAVVVQVVFAFPRPVGHLGLGRNAGKPKPSAPDYPAVKPDIDKLERAVLDGLTAGGAWTDDAQVVSCLTVKDYADAGAVTGCDIWIKAAKPKHRE
jgi:crossover junction endodeoxyribonuclease RusA